ncbi:MAG: methylated-DNA--[protein]-cysteine S-methyltransferase [Candidatus Hadarchaeum sp.]
MEITLGLCWTLWGWVGMAFSSHGLVGTTLPFPTSEEAISLLARKWPNARERLHPQLFALQEKLQRYFRGELVDFRNEILDMRQGTDFQTRVWGVVRSIPCGEVRSYGWVAAQVGSPHAARAVGRVMATNPFPIVVPCHRVVGSAGQLVGFGGGLDMKCRLLELEAAQVRGRPFHTT